ncbi:MAG: cell division protein FtsA, partial [Gammaproteobacteria bacterium]|nr:cell division protein FtsA [Gammaproteobacteria bacterium]
MKMASHLVAGLDIGATRTTTVIAEVRGQYPAHWIEVLGLGQVHTNGVHRDVVQDVEEMTERVAKAMREAELMAGCTVSNIYVGISGDQVQTFPSHGVVAISSREVSADDMARLHVVARAVALPHDRELLHTVPQNYTVDNNSGILHPVGMPGTRLESEVYLVTGASAIANNIRSAVSRAGYRVEKLILEPLAAARAVLREDEREIGVAVLDLGGATSQMAIFVDGRPYYTDMLPTGGVALTWDLVQHLHIQHEEARRVLENHGCAVAELVGSREMIEIPGPTPSRPRRIGRATVADALENRLTAIVAWCQRELNARELIAPLGTGVVLTGGVAALDGIGELVQRMLG